MGATKKTVRCVLKPMRVAEDSQTVQPILQAFDKTVIKLLYKNSFQTHFPKDEREICGSIP